MTGTTRRLVGLVARASRQQTRLAAQGGQFRPFAAMPATANEDDYRRFQAVKEKAHITVRSAEAYAGPGSLERRGWAGATRRCPQRTCSASRPRVPSSPRSGRRRATSRWRLWTRRWCVLWVPAAARCAATCSLVAPHAGGHHRAREEPPVEGEHPRRRGDAAPRLLRRHTRPAPVWAGGGSSLSACHSRCAILSWRHPSHRAWSSSRQRTSCLRPSWRPSAQSWCVAVAVWSPPTSALGTTDTPRPVQTNKYSEGYPGARYYGGNEFIDMAERCAPQVSVGCWRF
jgi:hypothetical protein